MPTPTIKIWIANDGGHPFEIATEAFPANSSIKFESLTTDRINPFSTDRILQRMRKKLAKRAERNLLLLSGHPIVNSLATIAFVDLFSRNGEPIELLIWDAKERIYVLRVLEASQVFSSND